MAQDEVDTWTIHRMVPPGSDGSIEDPYQFISATLGGLGKPVDIKVDKILLTGVWKTGMAVADSFQSSKGRVFLAGDSGEYIFNQHSIPSDYPKQQNLTIVLRKWTFR